MSIVVKQAHFDPNCKGCKAAQEAYESLQEVHGQAMQKIKEQAEVLAAANEQNRRLQIECDGWRMTVANRDNAIRAHNLAVTEWAQETGRLAGQIAKFQQEIEGLRCDLSEEQGANGCLKELNAAMSSEIAQLRSTIRTQIEINDVQAKKIAGLTRECNEVEQQLGKALGYPWYKDDQKNFPDTTEADGVCVGAHAPGTIAAEAANKIDQLQQENADLRGQIQDSHIKAAAIEEENQRLTDAVREALSQAEADWASVGNNPASRYRKDVESYREALNPMKEKTDDPPPDAFDQFYKALSNCHPSIARGQVWCKTCGRTQQVDSAQCLRSGWPKCCGYTMTIDSPEERKAK